MAKEKHIVQLDEYMPMMDWIKLICACLITIFHFRFNIGKYYYGKAEAFGVFQYQFLTELFFVISGFLCGLNRERNNKYPFGVRFGNKFCYLYIHAVITQVFSFIVLFGFHHYTNEWLIYKYSYKDALASFFMVAKAGIFSKYTNLNGAVWYVVALIRCLLIYYLTSEWSTIKRVLLYILMILIGIYVVLWGEVTIPFLGGWAIRSCYSFFAGSLLYEIRKQLRYKYCVEIGLALIGIYLIDVFMNPNELSNLLTLTLFLYQGIVLLASFTVQKKEKVIMRIGKYCRDISFYIYLWNMPIIAIIMILLYKNCLKNITIVTEVVFILLTIVFSIIYKETIGKLINKLCKRIEMWFANIIRKRGKQNEKSTN